MGCWTTLFLCFRRTAGAGKLPLPDGLLENIHITKGESYMKKRLPAFFLALVLCIGLAVPAFASVPPTAGERLSGVERRIYQEMKDVVQAVAAGKRTSTEALLFMEKGEMEWSVQELGLSSLDNENLGDALNEKIQAVLGKIYICLEMDLPFEMFWTNHSWNWTWYERHTGSTVWLTSLTVSFDVSPDYRGSATTTVDPDKIAQANLVKKAAESIVRANAGKSDYEKLAAYRDEICALNTYNDDAYNALLKDTSVYGDPWQLIHVFDNDPSTNVLCEGYAKAFKYLCDLSDFNGDVACYIVEGTEGNDNHMWNVVRMEDGKFYLADVTYSDNSQIGKDSVFMAHASGNGQKYVVSAGSRQYTYTYRDDYKDLSTDGFLPISSTPYTPSSNPPAPAFTDTPDWCAKEAQWAAQEGITNGYGAQDKFAPGVECTHEQILTFLWRAAGSHPANTKAPFTVASYYQDAVNWAFEEGFIGNGFDPAAPCTRSQAVLYIWQARGKLEAKAATGFTDVPDGAAYAKAVDWAVENGITKGDGSETTFAPDKVCSRGHIACFLYRAYHN